MQNGAEMEGVVHARETRKVIKPCNFNYLRIYFS